MQVFLPELSNKIELMGTQAKEKNNIKSSNGYRSLCQEENTGSKQFVADYSMGSGSPK